MKPLRLLLLSLLLLLLPFSQNALAKNSLSQEQQTFKNYYQRALKGDAQAVSEGKKKLSQYSLVHYLDYAFLRSQIAQLPIKEIKSFAKKHPQSPLNKSLKRKLAYELGRQKQWSDFLKHYKTGSPTSTSHCWYLNAKIATGDTKNLKFAVQNTWLNGLSLPEACDPVFQWFEAQGHITDELLQKRIQMTFEVNNASTARYLATKLSQKPDWIDKALSLMKDPFAAFEQALSWKDEEVSRKLILTKANSVASKNPKQFQSVWQKLKKHFSFNTAEATKVDRTLALFAATDYLPFTLASMQSLPADKYDAQIQAWKVRYHLYFGEWQEVKSTIEKMSDFQRKKDSWQYWLARAMAKTGDKQQAQSLFSKLAKKTNYYGFLAADHMRLPYHACSADISAKPIAKMPIELVRAFELFDLGMITQARAEWTLGYKKLNTEERRELANIALQKGWFNKATAINSALGLWSNYKLRYPLGYEQRITELASQYNILPQWIMSVITQESAWQTDAISSADARGLMQIIDPTAKRLSKKLGLNYTGRKQLHNANFNLTLGIFYQSLLLEQFDNHPILALASYNAGESKAEDWLQNFPRSPDVWAETIPYRETRGYIRKILTNVTIYDWLINGQTRRISSWMPTLPVNSSESKPWPNKNTRSEKVDMECDS